MDDSRIVELYWERQEEAITETAEKYGKYCRYIAYNILFSSEDAEECVNDTYMRAWNAIPPHRPAQLSTFLGKITRNLSLNRYKEKHAQKRGEGQVDVVLDELQEIICGKSHIEDFVDEMVLTEALNVFLSGLTQLNRVIFVKRYWYMSSIKDIAGDLSMNENSIATILFRLRKELKIHLEKEGIAI